MVYEFTFKLNCRVIPSNNTSNDDSKNEEVPQVYKTTTTLVRTQLLILDYKQFKAARIIQKAIRGWLVRMEMKRRNNAALVIQRTWWRYIGKHFRSSLAQQMLQTKIVDTFNNSSIKIQSFFRGWYSRKFDNNFRYLKIVQVRALEDILRCMVLKMCKLNEQNKLPGVLSFSGHELLLKLESFISTLSYRLFNCYVENHLETLKAMREARRKDFKESQLYTNVPYVSFARRELQEPESFEPAFKNYNKKEVDIAIAFNKGFDSGIAEDRKHLTKLLKKLLVKRISKEQQFCKDMCTKISNWSVLSDFDQDEMNTLLEGTVTEFLSAVKTFLQDGNYMESCDCVRDKKENDCKEMHS